MYEMPSSLLVANPLNRYLINSPMLPQMNKVADGGVTLLVQKKSPGNDKEANAGAMAHAAGNTRACAVRIRAGGGRAGNGRRVGGCVQPRL
jgi:hypothetical protein